MRRYYRCVKCSIMFTKRNWDPNLLCDDCLKSLDLCACCGDILDRTFPKKFPENFKFCCDCWGILQRISYDNDWGECQMMSVNIKRRIFILKDLCCGIVGEKSPIS